MRLAHVYEGARHQLAHYWSLVADVGSVDAALQLADVSARYGCDYCRRRRLHVRTHTEGTMVRERLPHLAILFFLFAGVISAEQYIRFGKWFEVQDIHHEMFIVTFAFAGIVLLIINLQKRRNVN